MSKLRGKNTQNIKIRQFGTEFQKHEACHKFFDVWLDIYRALWRWNFVQTFAVLLIHFRVTALRFDWLYRHFRSHANLIHLCVSVSDSIQTMKKCAFFSVQIDFCKFRTRTSLVKNWSIEMCARVCYFVFDEKNIARSQSHTQTFTHIHSICVSLFFFFPH